ncbi:MAG: GGDEF domain-containing protein [Deltaproteobacteria bacterium]|nr:GGDEF domain-containing protein [Deltaproteobacteria bacterium]
MRLQTGTPVKVDGEYYRMLQFHADASALPLAVPGFDVVAHAALDGALECLAEGGVDCVLVPCARAVPAGTERLQQWCDEQMVPLVLGLDTRVTTSEDPVFRVAADGLVDLRWPGHLVAAALRAAIQRVLVGRNLVDVQRRVLDVAQGTVDALEHLAFRDELTGLYNLRGFRDIMRKEHERCARYQRCYSLMFLDMDNLKLVNTSFGHAAGNRLLAEFGRLLASHLRACNYAFRVGGDEFVVLLAETPPAVTLGVAHRVRDDVSRIAVEDHGVVLTASVSIGIASYPEHGTTFQDVVARADQALYQAKALGRNRVLSFDELPGGAPGLPSLPAH